jgi:putative transposase
MDSERVAKRGRLRAIQGHLRDLYGIEASPQLISTVTDAVLEEASRWQM